MDKNKANEIRIKIGNGLIVARESCNMTQIAVGKTGIVRSNRLSQIELGKVSIQTEEFLALCELYNTTPDKVLDLGDKVTEKILQYKINKELDNMTEDELEILLHLLKEYMKKRGLNNQ